MASGDDASPGEVPGKRKRGRPPGKSTGAAAAKSPVSPGEVKRGRGRPPKERPATAGAAPIAAREARMEPRKTAIPHSISSSLFLVNVEPNEDIAAAIHSAAQKEATGVYVLSASGAISEASLRASHNAVQCKGRFEIVSMSGILLPPEEGSGPHEGALSVGMSSDEGKMLGGAITGPLLAATPCKVVLGRFQEKGFLLASAASEVVRTEAVLGA